ncbi:O-methyltransferase [Flavihumibacter fluvii]|uniref:O-methyltransferase n=1 Tax=Flavihumibacter fluvii TaxID=2838157 RepID=UPI001BDDFDEF|nr:class I SAM-dependent methyltransferase [Flavihumibacter fluvii]ULQ53414.1 class I SAM-dependent methyltransferase [Flavihumibacter fluvii]
MIELMQQPYPKAYQAIVDATKESGFTMASDLLTCTLLRSLAASKRAGSFLELGTGTGLATSWILDGMDKKSTLVSIDNDAAVLDIARKYLRADDRLELVLTDGEAWIHDNSHLKFDYIFADTWHGKYLMLEEALGMLKPTGIYIIDDMLPQPNWPEGHNEKAIQLVAILEQRHDLWVTTLNWATGIVIAVKK